MVLTYELSTGQPMPYWQVAALFAILADFLFTGVGVIDGFMVIKRQRDAAVADVREARIAVATDPLTDIANRRGLALRFRDSGHARPRGLAVIDCDQFKRINDMFGHDVGDEVLIAVAEGLKHDNVFPARQGGEEFVVLLYGDDWQLTHPECVDSSYPLERAIADLEAVKPEGKGTHAAPHTGAGRGGRHFDRRVCRGSSGIFSSTVAGQAHELAKHARNLGAC